MRRVRRAPIPSALLPGGSPGASERGDAIAHFTAPDWTIKERAKGTRFTFKAYSDPTVRNTLTEVFKRKCAYCERRIDVTQWTVIEHYRPKGGTCQVGINELRRPGYYWLAATWENLLPSCIRCNSAENQVQADGSIEKTGKDNWFPLVDESRRATAVGDERGEEPLLLHPYLGPDPGEHLEFVEGGVVRPRRLADGNPSPFGDATIRLLGLNRRGLVETRAEKREAVITQAFRVNEAEDRLDQDPDNEDLRRQYDREVIELAKLKASTAEYTAVVRDALA